MVDVEDLQQMILFIKYDMKNYINTSKVALINYGSQAILLAGLTSDQKMLYDALKKLSKVGGPQRIDLPLAKIEGFRGFGQDNNKTKQVILFVTGKNSLSGEEQLSQITQRLKNKGVKITVIGIGNNVDVDEAEEISSGKRNVILVNPMSRLPNIIPDLFKNIGENIGKGYCFIFSSSVLFQFHLFKVTNSRYFVLLILHTVNCHV